MAYFQYVGDDARVYPDLSLEVEPDDVVELAEMPDDGRWKKATKADAEKAEKAENTAEEA